MAVNDTEREDNFLTKIPNWFMNKFRNIIGVEFAEFGGIRQLSIINVVNPSEIPTMLVDLQDRVHTTLKRQWRQAITGSPEKRIRDNLNESHVKTKVQQVDAASFTLGVAVSYLTEWIILKRPTLFPNFFYVFMGILLINRFFTYRAVKEHFFMLDFCYALNLSTWLQTLFCMDESSEECASWFMANFSLAHGPIALAIIGWKNSLVFHSADKVTSFAIHIMPGVFCYLMRWEPKLQPFKLEILEELNANAWILYPLVIYITWQIFYIIVQFTYLDKDPSLVTSLRYLTASGSGKPATSWGYSIFKNLGLLREGETLDPFSKKTTFIVAFFQLVYVIICLLPVPLLYSYQKLNELFIIFLVLVAIWNGGSYYIQIFSQRYNDKFEKQSVKEN